MNDQPDLDELFAHHLSSVPMTVQQGSSDRVLTAGRRRAARRRGVIASAVVSVTALTGFVVVPRLGGGGKRVVIGAPTTITDSTSAAGGRQLAEAVLNELYAIAGRSAVLPAMKLPGRVDLGSDAVWAGHCGKSGAVAAELPTPIDTLAKAACFSYSVQPGVDRVTVDVTTRSECNADGTNCVVERYQQRWNRRTFLDYAVFTDQETLAPSLYPAAGEPAWVVMHNGVTHEVDQAWALDHCADRKTQDPASASTPTTPESMWGGTFLPGVVTGPDGDTRRRQAAFGSASAPRGLWSPWSGPNSDMWVGGLQDAGLRHEDCFEIAYSDQSFIDGPIKTNDQYLWYCGSPTFKDEVSTSRDSSLPTSSEWSDYFRKAEQTGCDPAANGRPVGNPPAPDPTVRSRPFEQMPQDLGDYATHASLTLNAATGHATITLTGTNNGATIVDGSGTRELALAPNSLVFVNGDLWLSSAADAETTGVTFMATGSITITGDLTGPASRTSDIGVVAQKAVVIKKPSKNLRIDASLMSIDETVYVTDWNISNPNGTIFNVQINGSIAARYRPVFGTFKADGSLHTGASKTVVYPKDRRPNPPYFPSPMNAPWERDEITESST
jgi:hypothetical protein